MKKVSIIFKEKPRQWGLRGDSYFWSYLEEKFSKYEFPFKYEEFERIVKEEHLKLTEVELTNESIGKCQEFAQGGMSSGVISGEFWNTVALPLLKKRLEKSSNGFIYKFFHK